MDGIISAITSAKSMNTGVAIQMSLMKKALDVVEGQGAQLVQDLGAMELSVNPNIGSNFDMRI